MVPSYFVVLDRLPLSPNGKVDYEALPAVGQSLMGQTDSFIAPRNDVEVKLCEIFSQVLGIEQVGVNDNFFRLGGHSLLAAQAAARIKEAFGVGLELRMFLESPTVASWRDKLNCFFPLDNRRCNRLKTSARRSRYRNVRVHFASSQP